MMNRFMKMKKTFLIIAALTMLVSCGGGASAPKEDEAGHNPRPSQIVSDTMQANVENPMDLPSESTDESVDTIKCEINL